MENTLVPLALFACIAYCVVGVTRAITDARTRRRLIEAGTSVDLVRAVIGEPPERDPYVVLRWGLIVGAVGLALVGVQFLPYDPDAPLPTGLVLLAGALGLLASYAVSRRTGARVPSARGAPVPVVARAADRPALPAPNTPQLAPSAPSDPRVGASPSTPVGADDLE